jgi:iron complex transport system ATP-binding protein
VSAPSLLEARGIRHAFGSTEVLHGVDLRAEPGAVTGLIGPNGSGKTTLLRCLSASLRPDAGTVQLDGDPVARMRGRERARRIAVVVQEAPGDLPLTVADVVLLGRTPHRGLLAADGAHSRDLAPRALERVGALHLASREFSRLSGGERQRVLIARALTQQPQVLLLDEPTNHLDIGYQHEVLDIVRDLGLTTVVVLHDLNLAARYCDHLAVLEAGRVRARGVPREVLDAPLIGDVYRVGAERRDAADGTAQHLFHRAPGLTPSRCRTDGPPDRRAHGSPREPQDPPRAAASEPPGR